MVFVCGDLASWLLFTSTSSITKYLCDASSLLFLLTSEFCFYIFFFFHLWSPWCSRPLHQLKPVKTTRKKLLVCVQQQEWREKNEYNEYRSIEYPKKKLVKLISKKFWRKYEERNNWNCTSNQSTLTYKHKPRVALINAVWTFSFCCHVWFHYAIFTNLPPFFFAIGAHFFTVFYIYIRNYFLKCSLS